MMKKLLTTIILILCCTYLQAQPPSVAGVQFGTSYEQAKPILDKRFNGGRDSYQTGQNSITYFDVKFADEYFTYVDFDFEVDAYRSYLSGITFNRAFELSESKAAKDMRDRLYAEFCKKYPFRWENINKDNYKVYVFGHNYFNAADGFIVISVYKGENKKGVTKLWTSIAYICNGFVNTQNEI
jgi:hypothetical protein